MMSYNIPPSPVRLQAEICTVKSCEKIHVIGIRGTEDRHHFVGFPDLVMVVNMAANLP